MPGVIAVRGQVAAPPPVNPINGTWWAPNSPWNALIPAGAFAAAMPNSASAMNAYSTAGGNVTTAFNVVENTFTAALIVAPAGTPTADWNFTYPTTSTSWTLKSVPIGSTLGTQILNAYNWFSSNSDTDRSINLYSTDTGMMYDIYPDSSTSSPNTGPIKIVTASVRPLNGSGWWNQAAFTTLSSGTASGADQVGGSIKPSEWTAGVIPHALMGAYPQQLDGNNPGTPDAANFVFPARGGDGSAGSSSSNVNWLPEGARLQLDPSLSDSTLLGMGVASAMLPVCHALQQYGWYCMDQDGTYSAQIKFLSSNPNATPGFIGSYPGAANLPLALFGHMAWIPGPWIAGSSGLGTGVSVTGTAGQCSYTTNWGSGDGVVHVGDIVTVYPVFGWSANKGTGALQGFDPSNGGLIGRGTTKWWDGVSYQVLSVGSGTFTLGTLAGGAITSTAGTMNVYFTSNAPLYSPSQAEAAGLLTSP